MRTAHRLFAVTLLLPLSLTASGCSSPTPTAPASAAHASGVTDAIDVIAPENSTAADTGSAARGGGATFGSGN